MIKNGAKGLNSSKWLLLVCAASAAVVDIVIIAMLFAGGEGSEYLACPFLLLIFDLFYFAVSLFFTNFRFKYSIGVWASYIVLYTVGFSIGLAIILGGEGTVLTNAALALWACVHAFNIVCAVVCALFASRVIGKMWLALAVAVVFIAGAVAYAGFMFSEGFFGQGKGSRTIVYSYNKSTGEYSVTGVLAGRSDRISVPATFNGKPVTAVSLNVFAESGVNEYDLPDSVAFTDASALSRNLNFEGKRINVDKKSVNNFREKFLEYAANGGYRANALALANATLPVNLAVNEGYVAFNYDADGYTAAGGDVIPVYVGDLESFDISAYTQGYDYVTYREDGSADNYYRAYENGGYILSDLGVSGQVTESTVAVLKFERVYRIKVDDGNDNKYPMREKQPELCFDDVDGNTDYKYLTKPMANTFLDGLTARKGFTNRWLCYIIAPARDGKYFTDLTEVLGDGITLSARWELKKPTLALSTSAANNSLTYGDDVTLFSGAQIESGLPLVYSWTYSNNPNEAWNTEDVSLSHPKPTEYAGTYSLLVRVAENDVTSCLNDAFATASIELKINPKPVTFDWHLPENTVYDGNIKTVSVSIDDAQQVEGNPLEYTFPGLKSFKDAGTYNFSIVTNVITDRNYTVLNPTNSVTIEPCPVAVDWTDYENLEYNGSVQCPAATATGVAADGRISVSVSGGNKNAGTYTATAATSNTNYVLNNTTRQYTIKPRTLNVTLGNATVVYGNQLGDVDIQYSGFADGEDESVLAAYSLYTVPAIGDDEYIVGKHVGGVRLTGLATDNYDPVVTLFGELTITQRTIGISWNMPSSLVYDGAAKNVTATATNKLAGDEVTLTVSGGNGITVDTYTATVTAIAGKDAVNYKLPSNVTTQYIVTKRTATIVWNVPSDPVYDGEEHDVTYTVQNLVAGDSLNLLGGFKYKDAGTYFFDAAGEDFNDVNYEVENSSVSFTVKPSAGAVEFFVNNISYDDYDTTVRVGDTIGWKGNSHIWSVTVYRNGEKVYPDFEYGTGGAFVYTDEGSYEIQAAGDYVFEIDIGGYDENTTRRTVTFKISGVLEREEVEIEQN